MPRIPRSKANSGCYHVIQRGNGKQILFEDYSDYSYFIYALFCHKDKYNYKIHAYCLMNNHFHLLIQTSEELGKIVKAITLSYSNFYNKKYERSGHLFQGRFTSVVIEDKEAFIKVFRYVLQNPEKAGICSTANYSWSSYKDYLRNSGLTDRNLLYKLIGGSQYFSDFMMKEIDLDYKDVYGSRRLDDNQAVQILKNSLGLDSGHQLQELNKEDRDKALVLLNKKGLSVRQIERLTGISRGVINRILSK